MIKHIVLFKFKVFPGKETRMEEIRKQLEKLVEIIPELKEIRVSLNINPVEKWDLSLEVIVESMLHLDTYANHPAHQEIVKSLIAPIKEDRACIDYRF